MSVLAGLARELGQRGREQLMSGWAETPGGGRLARMIADAFARAAAIDRQGAEDE